MEVLNIKNYELIKKLASGGQGDVYLARHSNDDLGLDKLVAIKIIDKKTCNKEAFKNEVKLLSKLDHPNICKILDVGEEENSFYIVMEYIDGINIKEFLVSSKQKSVVIPSVFVYEIGKNIFNALSYAHQLKTGKVLHRDVSLHNIMISKNGEIKLIDFGISELLGGACNSSKSGKPSYLPKRFVTEVEAYDESVDMYSLAVVLYELATKQRVSGEDDVDLNLVEDREIRKTIKALKDFKNDYEIFNLIQVTPRSDQDKNVILNMVSKVVDEKLISEKTIVTPSKRKNETKGKVRSYYLKITFVVLVIVSIGIYASLKKSAKSVFMGQVNIVKDGKVAIPEKDERGTNDDFKESVTFSDVSCEMFCLQVITNLTIGHQDTYNGFISKGELNEEFKNNYGKYLNQSLILYKKTQENYYSVKNRCSMKETCKYASSISRMMSTSVPLNLDQKTIKSNYDVVMKGSDSDINNVIKTWNKQPLVSGFITSNYSKSIRVISPFGFEYAIFKLVDEVNIENCKKVGDYEYLSRPMDMSLPYEATLNSSFKMLLFDSEVKIKDDKGRYSIEAKGKKFCEYTRVDGVLKTVQIWKY